MNPNKLISTHSFTQEYFNGSLKQSDVAIVDLIIDHFHRKFTIYPKMPFVGHLDYHTCRSQTFDSIDDVSFSITDIAQDFNRAFALQACIYRAMLFACEELSLAKPTEISDIERLFSPKPYIPTLPGL